ncbi:hypothetical protein HMPREF1985_01149 [Mitsuokella sp. oral taxon 131 str. W9106]|nr:hypothetical protein HMPREF1985_01149 [Mitsuokella sp. oral taxon 131 str. W9106]
MLKKGFLFLRVEVYFLHGGAGDCRQALSEYSSAAVMNAEGGI